MNYIRGFLMAWGTFTAIPCPYAKWDHDARTRMIQMLPIVGGMVGCPVIALWCLLDLMNTPDLLTGALLTAAYFCLTGFIHLDGFMDCSDAILSRRPEVEERQRILKDSHTGAFAVIALAIMLMLFVSAMVILTAEFTLWRVVVFLAILMISRGMASDSVLLEPPMKTSQYADLPRRKHIRWAYWIALAMVISYVLLLFLVADMDVQERMDPFLPMLIAMGISYSVGAKDRKQLDGMNGDISGHMIVMGETAGLLAAALLAGSM